MDRTCAACSAPTQPADPGAAGGTWSGLDDGLPCAAVSTCTFNESFGEGTEYEHAAPTLTTDRSCLGLTVCTLSEYEHTPPTLTTDRDCNIHAAGCPLGQHTSAAPTATADRVCQACAPGHYSDSPSNAAMQCTVCPDGYFAPGSGAQTEASCTQCHADYACAGGVKTHCDSLTEWSSAGSAACSPKDHCGASNTNSCPVGDHARAGDEATKCAGGTCLKAAGDVDHGTCCEANTCTCANGGDVATGAACTADNANICTGCADGFFLDTSSACAPWAPACSSGFTQTQAPNTSQNRVCTRTLRCHAHTTPLATLQACLGLQ